jgi:hypothetical protein
VQRDHCALLEDMQTFSITGDMQQLLQTLYASAAAALAMLSEEAGDRSSNEQGCRAAAAVLQVRPTCSPIQLRILMTRQRSKNLMQKYLDDEQQGNQAAPKHCC